jgi:putative tryptophan/tyrosine transport system substrate-binding protein
MKRRDFITLLGGTALAWPLAASAQQAAKTYRIGVLSAGGPSLTTNWSMFNSGLKEFGWIEGKNII